MNSQDDNTNTIGEPFASIDPGWLRVVTEYESRIGLLPMNSALEILISFYDDLGADVMIAAIQKTANDQPDRSYPYLKAILEAFVQTGVRSKEDAEQNIHQFKKFQEQWSAKKNCQSDSENNGEVRWFE